jgi:flavin-dependent dehydrogenase
MVDVEFVVVGCGPAGGTAAREAAARGVATVVLEKDPVVGTKRVCAAGLRPGFCEEFGLPREIVHLDPATIALHGAGGRRYELPVGPAHTTTREELDGAIARLAREAGAQIRTGCLFRGFERDGDRVVVEYADSASGRRERIRARSLFLAQGSTARIAAGGPLAYERWEAGLITCYQYRVYLERPAVPAAYRALEMHYYRSPRGRPVIAWMFPKRDHLSIGLGIQAKVPGAALREELDEFLATVERRLFPGVPYVLREEGNLLYGGAPRPRIADGGNVMLGGTAAGLVDATTGEGIHEAATTGRFAAEAVAGARCGRGPALAYERLTKRAFYRRLRHRHRLMTHLEAKPRRFDILFEQLAATPRFADLLQRGRSDCSLGEQFFLYGQALRFGLRSLRT